MKKLMFTLCYILTASAAFAATPYIDSVIKASNAKSHAPLIGTDYLAKVDIGSSTFPSFAPGGYTLWNVSGIVYDNSVQPVATRFSPTFPYNYADSVGRDFGNIHYYASAQTLYVLQGLLASAESIDSVSVPVVKTGVAPDNGTDTLVFKNQVNLYSSTNILLPFPLVYGNTWMSDVTYTETFLLTDLVRGYNARTAVAATPRGQIITHYMAYDTAQGHGKMKIKEPNGTTSVYANVIEVKRVTYERDSFTYGSAPMSDTLLSLFGLTQGNVKQKFSLSFYRVGRLSPLLKLNYSDSSMTTLLSAYVDTLQYAPDTVFPTSVPYIAAAQDVQVYPNPVANHTVNIDVPQAIDGNWSYDLINISGSVLAANTLPISAQQKHAQFVLPATVPAGTYYLRINNDGAPACIKTLTVIN